GRGVHRRRRLTPAPASDHAVPRHATSRRGQVHNLAMSAITTHVLDTSRGGPAAGIAVVLERRDSRGDWMRVGQGETDRDGRLRDLMPDAVELDAGVYRLMFDTRRYFSAQSIATLYPAVVIVFEVIGGEKHYHVPLLLSPFGYSTYR